MHQLLGFGCSWKHSTTQNAFDLTTRIRSRENSAVGTSRRNVVIVIIIIIQLYFLHKTLVGVRTPTTRVKQWR